MSAINSRIRSHSDFEINGRFVVHVVITFMRLLLGAWMVVSGWNHVGPMLGFPYVFPQPLGTVHLSNVMLVSLIETGLFDLVKVVELACGLCLLFNRWVPLALAVSLPVSYMVFHNSIVLNHRYDRLVSTYMSVWCLYLNVLLCAAYIRYYIPMLRFQAPAGSPSDLKLLSTIFIDPIHGDTTQ